MRVRTSLMVTRGLDLTTLRVLKSCRNLQGVTRRSRADGPIEKMLCSKRRVKSNCCWESGSTNGPKASSEATVVLFIMVTPAVPPSTLPEPEHFLLYPRCQAAFMPKYVCLGRSWRSPRVGFLLAAPVAPAAAETRHSLRVHVTR